MKTSIEGLDTAVKNEIDLYRKTLNHDVGEVFEEVAQDGVSEIKTASKNAGFNDRRYSKGWVKVVQRSEITGQYHITLHNKKYYRLTHLLEKGHALVNGGRSTAYPHIAPTQEKLDRLIVQELKEALEK